MFADNLIDFKGTGSMFCSIKHFYMLMNNSGLTVTRSAFSKRRVRIPVFCTKRFINLYLSDCAKQKKQLQMS